MNKKLVFTVLAVMTLAFTGCGANQVATSGEVTAVENQVEAGTVIVKHNSGETEVPKNPKNIVVAELGILDSLQALGVEVAGIPTSSKLPAYLSENIGKNIANVGSLKELDMEAIYALQPELIIIGGRQASYYDELSKIAPTINLAVDNANYMESFKTNMNYLGEIFNKEAEVAEKIEAVEADVEVLKAKAAEKNVNGLIALANDGAFSVYGPGSRFAIIHDTVGIKPVDETIAVSTHGQNASFEYVVEQNPDYLFVVDRAAVAGGGTSAAQLFDNDLIKTTNAYKNNHIIYLDANVWYTSGGGFTSTEIMVNEISQALDQ
ncbi:siderophore ABC transporter substrate-binding protein [Cellulosilyticum ruminicola]|uniref:siderophore ABC transporter substrate-binding protein n=1 Tax=Cellulosilyticum ruminicola TaxID=425254 RepID=UPI0006D06DEA|nr:siderophore ABC transporter substrate-binding protein [Cellulosilyticum ruminicola]